MQIATYEMGVIEVKGARMVAFAAGAEPARSVTVAQETAAESAEC